jgi:hypothetical protein
MTRLSLDQIAVLMAGSGPGPDWLTFAAGKDAPGAPRWFWFYKGTGATAARQHQPIRLPAEDASLLAEFELAILLNRQHQPIAFSLCNELNRKRAQQNDLTLKCFPGGLVLAEDWILIDGETRWAELSIQGSLTRGGQTVFGPPATSLDAWGRDPQAMAQDFAAHYGHGLNVPVVLALGAIVNPKEFPLQDGDILHYSLRQGGTPLIEITQPVVA